MSDVPNPDEMSARQVVEEIRARVIAINEMTTVEEIREEVGLILSSSTLLALHMDAFAARLNTVEGVLVKLLGFDRLMAKPQEGVKDEKAYEIVNGQEGRFNPGGYL